MKRDSWVGVFAALTFTFLTTQLGAAETMAQLRGSGARIALDSKTNVARFIGFDAVNVAGHAALAGATASAALQGMPVETAAAQHLVNFGGLFGLRDTAQEARVSKQREGRDGRSMVRYQQHHRGIPIIAGELIVNQNAQRQLTSISGKISPSLKLNTTPAITAEQAGVIARQAMAKWYQLPEVDFVVPTPTLSIYDSRLMSPFDDPVALVWRLDVTTNALLPINEFIAVDAASGVVALHFNQVPHAKNRLTYDANNANNRTNPTGVLVCDESSPNCLGQIQDAVSAHLYAGKTYDFYATNFARDGIDGRGLTMKSVVRVCDSLLCPFVRFQNAFWNGQLMAYGANMSRAEDVVAHELTHGVTQFESGLFYYYQSGAISESLSDIFGEFVQQSDPSGTVTASTKWQLGEDLAAHGFEWGDYLRSMSNPLLKGQPDKMTSSKYSNEETNLLVTPRKGDSGGVHTNSGVGNKAAYLMTDGSASEPGGQFNGRTVVGLGITKVAKIYYEVQTNLLTSGSDYLDLYNALFQACQNLIGQVGITSADCAQVRNATDAVEMDLEPVAGYNPEAAVCPTGQVAKPIQRNGYEFSSEYNPASQQVWSLKNFYAKTGTGSLYGRGDVSLTDQRTVYLNSFTLPANSFLRFDHAFEFEEGTLGYYDGGIVEYSLGGGAWTQLLSATSGRGYSGSLYSFGLNALRGKPAFAASSHGYVSTRFDLGAIAGQNVNISWRIGTDSIVGSAGWWIDNPQIYTCQAGFTLNVTQTGVGSGTVNSSPDGINSCSLPCNAGYATSTAVTLTASPAARSTFAGWSGDCTGQATCTVIMNAGKNVAAKFNTVDDGFPGAGGLPVGWSQPAGSNAPWFITSDTSYGGTQSIRSGLIGHSQKSEISYTGNFGAGNVSFARKVSSEVDYDYLLFFIDGVLRAQWSGELDWAEFSFPIAAGAHTLVWRYAKDDGVAAGSDAAWIDAVVLPLALVNTTTSLASLTNPSSPGQSVTLTALVAGNSGIPTGTVAFRDGVTLIVGCEAVALVIGTASCATSGLNEGLHVVTAEYSGNATYNGSTSSALTQGVISGGVFPFVPLIMLLL